MALSVSITRPELLGFYDGQKRHYGANQLWYPEEWQRRAGCGPTTAAVLTWYLAETDARCRALCPYPAWDKSGFLKLMLETWDYVTPMRMGANSPFIMSRGLENFGRSRGVELKSHVLQIPTLKCQRPPHSEVSDFLCTALAKNLPVAFLNLSNGCLHNLDSWHWVTLGAHNPASMVSVMFDQSIRVRIDTEAWLNTSWFGGAYVYAEPV